ncbi:MAG: hypothetical protein ABSG53_14170 [Thermoguttaceae bacterium]|jgi:hypothetical protein
MPKSCLTIVGLLAIVRNHANGHRVSVPEDGYSLSGLARAAAAHCDRLPQG